MAKRINFFDGAESGTVPTIGNIVASALVEYPDDATYEASEQGAPATGNLYYNTTLNLIRYYNGTEWITIVDEKSNQVVENKTIDGTDATGNNEISIDSTDSKYDNSSSGLSATNAQEAIDEVESRVDTNETNIAQNTADISDLETLSGSPGGTDHGTFTGTTIPDNSNTKESLQALETEVEAKIDSSEKGAANGVATLDGSSKVPAAQLPSYVDDVEEYADLASFPVTGETGKIYVALDTNKTYRWTGATYIEVSASDVTSVNGQTGTVVLDTDDVSEGATNKYYDDALVSANSDVVANTAKVSADGSIDTHSDVDTSTTPPTEGQALVWDSVNMEWIPGNAGSGSGAGKKNYLEDGEFENGITDASVYDDGGSYVDGDGGSPAEISISQTGFSLAGDNSLAIDKAGSVSAVGEGVSLTTQTIDLVDLGKDLFFQFAYDANDNNYTSDDVILKAYDVTNSEELPVIPIANLSPDGGLFKKLTTAYGKILVNATTQVVRLSLHVETDTAVSSAWTITVDEVIIGPSGVLVGNISTETKQYSPVWSGGSPSIGNGSLLGTYRREGDTLYGTIYLLAGSTTTFGSGQWEFSLPSGLTIDSSKLNNSSQVQNCGVAYANDQTGTIQVGTVQAAASNNTVYVWSQGTGASWRSTQPFTWANTDYFSIEFKLPISEWSNGNLISANEISAKTVKVAAAIQTGESLTADTTDISFGVETLDTHGVWNTNQFTAPFSGTYDIEGLLRFTANAQRAVTAYVNGTAFKTLSTNAYNGILSKFSGNVKLDRGDVLSIRIDTNETTATGIQTNNWITIEGNPDFSHFGVYGETEYKEVILSANTVTTTANVPVDVAGASIPLSPGEWEIGWGIPLFFDYISGSSLGVSAGVFLTDSANNIVSSSEANHYKVMSSEDDQIGPYSFNHQRIVITEGDTYKLRMRCNQTDTAARVFADVTSSYGDGKFWARRIK